MCFLNTCIFSSFVEYTTIPPSFVCSEFQASLNDFLRCFIQVSFRANEQRWIVRLV